MRVLGLIPARGGSKGVKRKNIRTLQGKPLIVYTIDAALKAEQLSRVILSTDDGEIAAVGRSYGVEVPFLRPTELAQDDTPMLPVVQHALTWMMQHDDMFDAVCLLQPTNPLRRSEDIDACIELFEKKDADAVISVLQVPHEYHPNWVYFQDPHGVLRLCNGAANPTPSRQQLPPAFHREGSVYVTRSSVILNQNSLYGTRIFGYPIQVDRTVNIDEPVDWVRAERLLGAGYETV